MKTRIPIVEAVALLVYCLSAAQISAQIPTTVIGCSDAKGNPVRCNSGSGSGGGSGPSGRINTPPPPSPASLAVKQGLADEAEGHWGNAASAFQRAVELDPTASNYAHLALALSKIGRLDDAIAAARRGFGIDPRDRWFKENLALLLYNKAIEFKNNGNNNAAEPFLREALEVNPDDLVARAALEGLKATEKKAEMQRTIGLLIADLSKGNTSGGLEFMTDASAVEPSLPDELSEEEIRATRVTNGINALAKRLKWAPEEQERLDNALKMLRKDGIAHATSGQIQDTWLTIRKRKLGSPFLRLAARGAGPSLPTVGKQIGNECAVIALANAAGVREAVVASKAYEFIRNGEWRNDDERARPFSVIEGHGLNGGELIMLAEFFGQARVVPSQDFVKTLKEGRAVILANVIPPNGDLESGHQVVISKTFKYRGKTWFEIIDSNSDEKLQRQYLTAGELGTIIRETGVALIPDARSKSPVK